jgi:G:T/U-mismatch repair DNA glycosylase
MEKSSLIPFLRKDLDILFVGLNPATGSSRNKHYFSVNQAFWNQLLKSGLITEYLDKSIADSIIFGSTKLNYKKWNYGITDLVTEIAESDSSKIKPKEADSVRLEKLIKELRPKTVVILHRKVLTKFSKYLGQIPPKSNTGKLGKIIKSSDTTFFNIAFPHGNSITSEEKNKRYIELKDYLKNNTP